MTKIKLWKSAPLLIAIFGLIFLSLAFSVPTSGADSFNPFQPPHSIEVRVCYSDDTPVVGASVTLNNTNKTGKEVQGTTDENGEWSVEVTSTIDAQAGDEILITTSINAEKTQSEILVINMNEDPQVVNFVFEKESESPGDGDGSGDGSGGGSSSDRTTPVPTPAETESNAADKETDTEQQPSPSQSASIEGEGESATLSPLLEDGDNAEEGTGKSKGIPGFQFMYAGLAGLIAIAAFFSIRKLRGRKILSGGEKR